MSSFFEKLKKGMRAEVSEKELDFKKEPKKPSAQNAGVLPKEIKPEKQSIDSEIDKISKFSSPLEMKNKEKEFPKKEFPKKVDEKKQDKAKSFVVESLEVKEKWFEQEGQLAIDIYQTETDLVIQSAIAGVKPQDLDISIESDIVLIKGKRMEPPENGKKNYFYQECYWGPFSRQIILPEEADPSRAKAELKDGLLIIRMPKIERMKKRKIEIDR